MCGRFALHTARERLATCFHVALSDLPELAPRYNIAPSQPVLALRERQGTRVAELLRWGLVPHWAERPEGLPSMINARIETLTERPAFRQAVRTRRCLIPAHRFYEGQAMRRASRQAPPPYYVGLARGAPCVMAEPWEVERAQA